MPVELTEAEEMNMREHANMIIKLRDLGLTEEQINDFMIFVETNNPTPEQAEEAKNRRNVNV